MRHADLVLLVRQLAALVRRGRTLDQALEQLSAGATLEDYPGLRDAASALRAGEPADKALSLVRGAPALLGAATAAAAGTGRLAQTLDDLGRVFAAAHAAERRVAAAALYPAVLTGVLVGTLGSLSFLTPELARMYGSFGGELPAFTRLVFAVFSPPVALVVLAVYAAGALAFASGYRRGAAWVERFVLAVPGLGPLARDARVAAYTGALSAAAEAGIAPERAGALAAPLLSGVVLPHAAAAAARGAQAYAPLVAAVADPFDALRIKRREPQGPAEALRGLSNELRLRSLHLAQRFEGIVEPVTVLVLGLAVGLVLIAVYMPIFAVTGAVK